MKRITFLKSLFLLCALIAGSSNVWADTEDIVSLGYKTWTNGSYTSNDVTITAVKGSGSDAPYKSGTQLRVYNGNTVTISIAAGNITSIRFVATSSSNGVEHFTYNNAPISSTAVASYTWNAPSQMSSVTFGVNGTIRWTEVHVTYAVGPTINASSPVDYAADITSGEIPYTVSNPTTGKSLTAASEDDWISNISVGAEKVTFDMEENTGEARTGTITLSYEGATSKDIIINQAAAVAKHTVTINACENGSLAVLRGEDNVASGSEIPEGTKLTICAIPDIGYRFRNWQYNTGSSWTTRYTNNQEYEMPVSDVQFRANFEAIPQYTYSWSVNGVEVKSETLYEGDNVAFPSISDMGGKVFYGWVTTSSVDQDEEPSLVSTTDVTASANTTYYAVFATKTAGDIETKKDELTRETTGITGSTYTGWSYKAVNGSDAVYKGNSAGGNSSIQLRSSDNSGIVSITSGGKLKKVVVTWNSNTTNARTLDIYGKNSAYSETSELYSVNQGDFLGSIVKGTSTTLDVDGDYEYLGMRSHSNAMYITKIEITWETGTPDSYSDFTTIIPPTNVTITDLSNVPGSTYTGKNYATMYYSDKAFAVPEGVVAKTYKMEGGVLTESRTYENGGIYPIIPAGEAVVVESDVAADYSFVVSSTETTPDAENALCGTDATTTVDDAGYKYYKLALNNDKNKVGFFFAVTGGTSINNGAHKAYLRVATGAGAKNFYLFDDTATGINNVVISDESDDSTPMYNLAGQRVNKSYKGVVIQNGKKMFNK